MSVVKSEEILAHLQRVETERAKRATQPALGDCVERLKTYQHQRFAQTHADLLVNPRYRDASRFFLEQLYGPGDFSRRDKQFARVVPAMIRLFPGEVVGTVAALAELHAISEQLDTRMAEHLLSDSDSESVEWNPHTYVLAWQAVGESDSRRKQIELSLRIGRNLDRLTRSPLIRHSLRMMRGPSKAAGLHDLQVFLEAGFEAFRAMRGSDAFLAQIEERERQLADAIERASAPFKADPVLAMLPS